MTHPRDEPPTVLDISHAYSGWLVWIGEFPGGVFKTKDAAWQAYQAALDTPAEVIRVLAKMRTA